MNALRDLKNFLRKHTLKKRLIIHFMATILLMSVTSIFPFYTISVLMEEMSNTFEMNVKLNDLHKTLENLNSVYEEYLNLKYSRSLDDYYKYCNALKKEADSIKIDYSNIENALILKDIKNMIATYMEQTDAAVMARRGRDVDEYYLYYSKSNKIFGYINEYIQKLNNSLFLQNTDRYLSVNNRVYLVETLNIGVIVSVVLLNIILMIWFIHNITQPISELSKAADEITQGNYDVPHIQVDYEDEIGVMARAFNRMTQSIREYVSEIKEKAELESRLKQQEMENLRIKSDLKEAELHALQAQINPHFLFNTLNTGAQLAMLEGADRACTFIERTAELLRYNLRNLDKPVTIGDEIKNIENYMHLLKERFADKIEFILEIDKSILDVKMPSMILQPIVENALMHGLGDIEHTGTIWVKACLADSFAEILIKDNGKGISEERIQEILTGKAREKDTNKSNGIAIHNILSRLKIFYNEDNIMSIYSEIGGGTEVVLRIPLDYEGRRVSNG
ncbi:sensor histidine kinase [Defluviitalea raffinosedens]|uniref:sensor histidine kinase n=1 Tax=Defluviitalea raffinosedens TaxID=1450156 RepID=UPI00195724EE|nr:sensor histidine kinase [Defluviitalea raffinosedens]MBM7685100.1 sensor histidine kinase YesM [Defluviitalea raffinosedens]